MGNFLKAGKAETTIKLGVSQEATKHRTDRQIGTLSLRARQTLVKIYWMAARVFV
jgi:hypothetical protein